MRNMVNPLQHEGTLCWTREKYNRKKSGTNPRMAHPTKKDSKGRKRHFKNSSREVDNKIHYENILAELYRRAQKGPYVFG